MSSLYDFIQAERQTLTLPADAAPGTLEQATMVTDTALVLEESKMPADKALKFAKELTDLVASDSFLKELSQEIREPGLTESEEAFVMRCKDAMKKLLDRRLG